MNSSPASATIISRVKRVLAELDYAQRRSFEIQTGVPLVKPDSTRAHRRAIDELESLYAYERPDSTKP